jgi:hypothetical protein
LCICLLWFCECQIGCERSRAIIHSLGGGKFHLSLSGEFNLLEYVPR